MIAFYAPVIVNYGNFSRFVRSEAEMRKGNLLGLMANILVFGLLVLLLTASTKALFSETITSPTEIVRKVDDPLLSLVAAFTFLIATVGINVVANFVPPANDISNLMPRFLSFRRSVMIAATLAFIVSAL